MNCHFCQKQCESSHFYDKNLNWHNCSKCNTSYIIDDDNWVHQIIMSKKIRALNYVLMLNYKTCETSINIVPYNPDDTIIMVSRFPFLLQNVTPSNLGFKIKTSVVFS